MDDLGALARIRAREKAFAQAVLGSKVKITIEINKTKIVVETTQAVAERLLQEIING